MVHYPIVMFQGIVEQYGEWLEWLYQHTPTVAIWVTCVVLMTAAIILVLVAAKKLLPGFLLLMAGFFLRFYPPAGAFLEGIQRDTPKAVIMVLASILLIVSLALITKIALVLITAVLNGSALSAGGQRKLLTRAVVAIYLSFSGIVLMEDIPLLLAGTLYLWGTVLLIKAVRTTGVINMKTIGAAVWFSTMGLAITHSYHMLVVANLVFFAMVFFFRWAKQDIDRRLAIRLIAVVVCIALSQIVPHFVASRGALIAAGVALVWFIQGWLKKGAMHPVNLFKALGLVGVGLIFYIAWIG